MPHGILFKPSLVLCWLGLAFSLTISGCGGCKKSPTTASQEELKKKLEEERKKKEKPKPDFVVGKMMTQPNSLETVEGSFKPGHWTNATVEMIANNFDFNGELVTEPFDLEGVPFRLGTSRPALLPKGQKKFIEFTCFIPPGHTGNRITTRLLSGSGGRELIRDSHPAIRMRAHQFYFFVLARDPDRYAFLKVLNSVAPPLGMSSDLGDTYYRVMLPTVKNRTPLPSNPLTWTSIAYLLWDDKEPDVLTPEQQTALVDWLHWGGQLIISGPGSLDLLKTSFLKDYLPATAEGELKLAGESFDGLNERWNKSDVRLKPARPWSGIRLKPAEAAEVQVLEQTPLGDPLVVERRVGRGGIVVTAFRISQRELVAWKSFDNFLNACLLRRPPRIYKQTTDGSVTVDWHENSHHRKDPELISNLRYFSRDEGAVRSYFLSQADRGLDGPTLYQAMQGMAIEDMDDEEQNDYGAGVAGWDDFNAAANTARDVLKEAAGIGIPDASFVVMVMGVYLAVLVPLNWAVFRALGRVELAWVSAPIITLIFAVAVIRLAQLDIGFARARTELAIVETNGPYPRAHVTRYTALYTSLSTSYDLRFDDASALVQPFAPFSRGDKAQGLVRGQRLTTVNYRRAPPPGKKADAGANISLEGFEVSSNSLGLLHSEHMLDLEGGIDLRRRTDGGYEVVNDTLLALEGAGVIAPEGIAWLGTLEAGAAKPLHLVPRASDRELWSEERDASPETRVGSSKGANLNVRRLLLLAEKTEPGETRLVAWTSGEIPGVTIEPSANQGRRGGVIVAHLSYGQRPAPRSDANSRIEMELDNPSPADGEPEPPQ